MLDQNVLRLDAIHPDARRNQTVILPPSKKEFQDFILSVFKLREHLAADANGTALMEDVLNKLCSYYNSDPVARAGRYVIQNILRQHPHLHYSETRVTEWGFEVVVSCDNCGQRETHRVVNCTVDVVAAVTLSKHEPCKKLHRRLQLGDIEIDFEGRKVRGRKQQERLTPKEFDFLSYLAAHANRVVTHRELLSEVWGSKTGGEKEYLRVFINHLRKKIERAPEDPRYLLTEYGLGYRLRLPDLTRPVVPALARSARKEIKTGMAALTASPDNVPQSNLQAAAP